MFTLPRSPIKNVLVTLFLLHLSGKLNPNIDAITKRYFQLVGLTVMEDLFSAISTPEFYISSWESKKRKKKERMHLTSRRMSSIWSKCCAVVLNFKRQKKCLEISPIQCLRWHWLFSVFWNLKLMLLNHLLCSVTAEVPGSSSNGETAIHQYK